jgi:hypothetical protein
MPYIGRPLNAGNLAVQSGTGDGSDTTPIATLDYSVGSSNSIGVYLDGVRQLAGTDFTASGTVLTFTTAPANGVGIDVYFLGLELSIPTPADATVTTAKIAANAVDETKLKDALVADFTEVVVAAGDSFLLGDSSDSGNTKRDTIQGIIDLAGVSGITSSANATAIAISADEEVTMPLQPCFQGRPTTQSNVTGNNTLYTVTHTTEVFDRGGDYDGTTFTAPITGIYLLVYAVGWTGAGTAADNFLVQIVTSNNSYGMVHEKANTIKAEGGEYLSMVADMDAGDTAHTTIRMNGVGSDATDIRLGYTYFSGCLLA